MAHIQDRWHRTEKGSDGTKQQVHTKLYGTGSRWRVRYRDPDRRECARDFRTKAEAKDFAASIATDIRRGEYIDPRGGRVTFEEWAEKWIASKSVKPKTLVTYRSILDVHLLPAFGRRTLSSIRNSDVRAFFARKVNEGCSRSRLSQMRSILTMIFEAAVEDGRLARSPVGRIKLPQQQRKRVTPLTAQQVADVAKAAPERYRALVYLLAYGGLRWGEITALRRSRVNLLRHRIEVSESAAEVNGELLYGPTKTYQIREVPLPKFLSQMLAEHLAEFVQQEADALVFTAEGGGALYAGNFRQRVWWPALDGADLPRSVRIHDLRHTCASLLIAQGRNAKQVQTHLGHSSVQMSFDLYGRLFPDDADETAAALDEVHAGTS